jgi:hypothetical protein
MHFVGAKQNTFIAAGFCGLFICQIAEAQSQSIPTAATYSIADIVSGVAQVLPSRLPGISTNVTGTSTLSIMSPQGAEVEKDLGYLSSYCNGSGKTLSACIREQVDWISAALATPKSSDLRIRLAIYMGGSHYRIFGGGAPWARQSFGPFQEECYKNGPSYAYPLIEWDGKNLGLDFDQTAIACERDTRQALGSLAIPADGAVKGKIAQLSGPFEASRTLFLDQWAPLAKQLGTGLLIAVPDTNTVLFTADMPGAVPLLEDRARQLVPDHRKYEDLSADVFRWNSSGWQLVSDHEFADRVAAQIAKRLPEAHITVVDARRLEILEPSRETSDYMLEKVISTCANDKPSCDDAVNEAVVGAIAFVKSAPQMQ